ncbi:prepilin peptidase [Butyrivibrio sp. VCD2006]|uniref:prepilin peptidase n=1 Tax=Butyrivibrio sp. VCD2006 TaxID=1280664 RepID=UPI00041F3006|nr:prepilin peptidase [Butyrivibrio sp. VCD2006]
MDFYEVIDNAEIISMAFRIFSLMILLIAAAMDIREKKIPISIPAAQMFLSLIYFLYLFIKGMEKPGDLILSMLPGLMLLTVAYMSKKGIGLGDGLMVLSLGPLFGMEDMLLAVLISFTLSAIVGAVLLILKKVNGKSTMAFIPFLTVGVGVMSFAVI